MKLLACVMALMLVSGCSLATSDTVAQRNKLPVINKPDRPKMVKMTPEQLQEYAKLPADIRKILEDNNNGVQLYAEQLEVGVTEYNGYAKYNNQLMHKQIGIDDTKTQVEPSK